MSSALPRDSLAETILPHFINQLLVAFPERYPELFHQDGMVGERAEARAAAFVRFVNKLAHVAGFASERARCERVILTDLHQQPLHAICRLSLTLERPYVYLIDWVAAERYPGAPQPLIFPRGYAYHRVIDRAIAVATEESTNPAVRQPIIAL